MDVTTMIAESAKGWVDKDPYRSMPPPPHAGVYGVIYPDPPWHTITWSGKGRDRCPDGERLLRSGAGYPTMTLDELKALPVGSWGARNCRLFMWTTDAHLPQAIELGEAWGFTFSGIAFTWVKLTNPKAPRKPCELCGERKQVWHFGGGHWTRKNPEQCLGFLRGNLNRRSRSVRQLVIAPVREPGRKPDEVYGRIEALVDGPYLEMFARQIWPGWDAWGDQVGRFDRGTSKDPSLGIGQPAEHVAFGPPYG